jgi:hypothetical protein
LRRGLKKVLKFSPPLGRYATEKLHDLRIACKRLRYAAEFLSDVYPEGLGDLIGPMKRMQGLLGDVHDADVYADRIARYCARARFPAGPLSVDEAVAGLSQHLGSWRQRSLSAANDLWRKFTRGKEKKALRKLLRKPLCFRYPEIKDTVFGRITIDGKLYEEDVRISADGRVRSRKTALALEVYGNAHLIGPAELRQVCRGAPAILYVGTGQQGRAELTPEGQVYLSRQGIECRLCRTPDIPAAYNGERRPKAAILHVTS